MSRYTDDGPAAAAGPAARRRHGNGAAALGVLWIVLAALACASVRGRPSGDEYEDLVRHNDNAREKLAFGMSKAEAGAIMGTPSIVPPWANPRQIGPQIVANPLDTLELEAPNGDHYEVQRYAVSLEGEWRCPFVRGEAELVPLIYLDEKLVGWRWSYLESALQRRLEPDELSFRFGEFCGSEAGP